MILLFFHRIFSWIVRKYRTILFCRMTHSCSKDVYIVKDFTIINKNVWVGRGVTIYPGVMFFGQGKIVIGNNVSIGNNTIMYASPRGGIEIGNNTMIAADCYITDSDHYIGINRNKESDSVDNVRIGEDVWLSTGVKVLKGSKIGDHSVIGANAVVKSIINSNSVAVGVPAKTIKQI